MSETPKIVVLDDPHPILPRKMNPALLAVQVDNPPFGGLSKRMLSWGVSPYRIIPQGGAQLIQSVDNPPWRIPGAYSAWLSDVLAAWQPTIPVQQLPRKVPTVGPVPDAPPIWGTQQAIRAEILQLSQPSIWPYISMGAAQPYTPRKLAPQITAVRVDDPPFNGRLFQPYIADATPFQQVKIRIIQAGAAAAQQSVFSRILQSWQPELLPPQRPRLLPPQITAVQVDDPPFKGRLSQPYIADATPFQQPKVRIVQAGAAPVAEQVSFYRILQAWQPELALPQRQRLLSPQITAVQVDNPPPNARFQATTQSMLSVWFPPIVPQQPLRFYPQEFVPPPLGGELPHNPYFLVNMGMFSNR